MKDKQIINLKDETNTFRAQAKPEGDQAHFFQNPVITFVFRFVTFRFDFHKQAFVPTLFKSNFSGSDFYLTYNKGCQTSQEYQLKKLQYGLNAIDIPMKPIPRLLVDEVLNPFYIFQVFSIILWFNDGYKTYAICIMVISLFSAILAAH